MTIDQKSLAEDTEDVEKASQFIRTWPPSEDELNQLESDLKTGQSAMQNNQTSSHVEEWPEWLQKQWIASQRRRAWQVEHPSTVRSRLFSPSGILMIAVVAIMILVTVGVGATLNNRTGSSPSTSASSGTAYTTQPATSTTVG